MAAVQSKRKSDALNAVAADRREDLRRFIETGEATDDFLRFLDADPAAQRAVEQAFDRQSRAFEQVFKAIAADDERRPTGRATRRSDRAPDGVVAAGTPSEAPSDVGATVTVAAVAVPADPQEQLAEVIEVIGNLPADERRAIVRGAVESVVNRDKEPTEAGRVLAVALDLKEACVR